MYLHFNIYIYTYIHIYISIYIYIYIFTFKYLHLYIYTFEYIHLLLISIWDIMKTCDITSWRMAPQEVHRSYALPSLPKAGSVGWSWLLTSVWIHRTFILSIYLCRDVTTKVQIHKIIALSDYSHHRCPFPIGCLIHRGVCLPL